MIKCRLTLKIFLLEQHYILSETSCCCRVHSTWTSFGVLHYCCSKQSTAVGSQWAL